jgi:hypothetical protein
LFSRADKKCLYADVAAEAQNTFHKGAATHLIQHCSPPAPLTVTKWETNQARVRGLIRLLSVLAYMCPDEFFVMFTVSQISWWQPEQGMASYMMMASDEAQKPSQHQ